MRLVLDTSVMVAAVRSPTGASAALLKASRHGVFEMLVSVGMMLEYEAVLKRPQQLAAAGLASADIDDLLDAICVFARPVTNHYRWRPALSDPDDDLVLETAVNGNADAIVTFNQTDFARAKLLFGIQVELPSIAIRRIR